MPFLVQHPSIAGCEVVIYSRVRNYTIVWTISVRFMPDSQNISEFSESFSHKRNSQKNKIGCAKRQPQRGEMFIEIRPPRHKPQRGEMFIVLKIVQSLV